MRERMRTRHIAPAKLGQLIDEIYSAVEEPHLWPRFLTSLADAVSAKAGVIHSEHRRSRYAAFAATVGFDAADLRRYAEHYVTVNPYLATVKFPGDIAVPADALVDLDQAERGEYFNDFLAPQRLGHPAGVILRNNADAVSTLTLLPPSQRRMFTPQQFDVLRLIAPHFNRAVRLHFSISTWRHTNDAFDDALDAADVAVMLLDASLKVKSASRSARALLERRDALMTDHGVLRAVNPVARAPLERFLRRSFEPGVGDAPGVLMLLARPTGAAYQLLGGPFRGTPDSESPAAQVLLIIGNPDARAVIDSKAIVQLYGLTSAESAVATRLTRGATLAQVADELRISLFTVKTHLKRVFEKVGVARQSELVRILSSIPGNTTKDEDKDAR